MQAEVVTLVLLLFQAPFLFLCMPYLYVPLQLLSLDLLQDAVRGSLALDALQGLGLCESEVVEHEVALAVIEAVFLEEVCEVALLVGQSLLVLRPALV